jgi:crotonobetainyl-CoA:carnitine CoA-transferase CaiB-like acyl-CoA transferase
MPARVMVIVLVLILGFGLFRVVFGHHETQEERIAWDVTVALQQNDLPGVQKWQNAETATEVTREIVGRAADAFAPLGKLEQIREASADPQTRVHQFDVTFDKGVVRETVKFDPSDKIVGFKYDLPDAK